MINRHVGGACGLTAVEWCFDQFGVLLICETTAVDNDRSIRLLSRLGFRRLDEVISARPDGATRPSLYWEMCREDWASARSRKHTGYCAVRNFIKIHLNHPPGLLNSLGQREAEQWAGL